MLVIHAGLTYGYLCVSKVKWDSVDDVLDFLLIDIDKHTETKFINIPPDSLSCFRTREDILFAYRVYLIFH